MASRLSSKVVKAEILASNGLEHEIEEQNLPVQTGGKPVYAPVATLALKIYAVAIIFIHLVWYSTSGEDEQLYGEFLRLSFDLFFYITTAVIIVKCLTGKKNLQNVNISQKNVDFDNIFQQLARRVRLEGKENQTDQYDGDEQLQTPILMGPPSHEIYRMQDTQIGIYHRKTGHAFLEQAISQCILSLSFTKATDGWSFYGSRVCQRNPKHVFQVKNGFVAMTTKAACWEETNDQGERRVISGQFRDDFCSFNGEWLSLSAFRGSLTMLQPEPTLAGYCCVPLGDLAPDDATADVDTIPTENEVANV